MDWVESKSVWGLRPEFAEIFVGREAFEGLESSGEVVGSEEVGQVRFELVRSLGAPADGDAGDIAHEVSSRRYEGRQAHGNGRTGAAIGG